MSAELTELLENVSEPAMFIDAETVLIRGRRRRLRRRLYGTAAVLGAAALIGPVAAALGADSAPSPVPAASAPVDCVFPDPGPGSGWDSAAGLSIGGTPWLDSGPPAGARTMRVQVNTDTCQGLAVAVSHPSSYSGTTASISGRPRDAFWVVDVVGGGIDRFGKALPVVSTAVALLPDGQRVCGVAAGPQAEPPSGQSPRLTGQVTTTAGRGWQATFARISSMGNPQGATLRVCDGAGVVKAELPPLNAMNTPEPVPTGSAVTYSETRPDGRTLMRDGNATLFDAVTCPGGTVNSGTVDGPSGVPTIVDLRDAARTWADATGLLRRFPGATLTVEGDERTATAAFIDQDAVRAELTYRRAADGWTLDRLSYC